MRHATIINGLISSLTMTLYAGADGIVKPRQKVIDTVKKPEMFDKVRLHRKLLLQRKEYDLMPVHGTISCQRT